MKFSIEGFNSSKNDYSNLDMKYEEFNKLLAIRVELETDKLIEVQEQFNKFIENSEIFKAIMGDEQFKDNSIKIYKEFDRVHMVYCGESCEDAYNTIIQFMSLLEL